MTLASPRIASGQQRQRLTPAQAAKRLQSLPMAADVDHVAAINEILSVAAELTGALGVVFLPRDAGGRLALMPGYFAPSHFSQLRSLQQNVARVANAACAEVAPQAATADGDDELLIVAVPLLGDDGTHEALAIVMGAESPSTRATAAYLTQLLTWIAAYLAPFRHQDRWKAVSASNVDLRRVNAVLQDASEQPDLPAGCSAIAGWLRDETNSPIVILGLRQGWQHACRMTGYSGSRNFDKRSENVGLIEELLEETLLACEQSCIDETLLDTRAVVKLARQMGLQVVHRYPLVTGADKEPFGAILCLREVDTQASEHAELPAETLLLVSQRLSLLQKAQPGRLARLLGTDRRGQAWHRHPFFWTTCAALVLLMLLPMPLKIKCPCQVQPKHRRFISVPYEGRLEQALTKPGELVEQGQLLARMDGRDIRWEISGLTADLRRAQKDRDTAQAAFDTAAAQMAGLEAQRLQLQIQVLEQRLQNLEIRSPVDGVVMGGDPRKLEGARLSMGETLFEVGPLDEMIVELQIADEDISHVQLSQQVGYRLSAIPWRRLQGPISLIHPKSEIINNENVFVAEVSLENADQLIRPGMRGRAKITADYHPLGWNLFHKAWDGFINLVAW